MKVIPLSEGTFTIDKTKQFVPFDTEKDDLREGKMTLPVLYAIRNGNREAALKVQQVLDERDFRTVDRAEISRIVEQSEGLDRTRKLAEDYARRAIQMLSEFPPSIYRDAMECIPEFILNRSA